jgi:DNA-binding transcriptional MerR regulator
MEQYSISQLSSEFEISTRTIRYYEEKGLLSPKRTNTGQRIYTKTDGAILKLILRGKRFGFSLDEIKEMIELFNQDRSGKKQLEKAIEYGETKLKEVNERIEDLMYLKKDLEAILQDFKERLRLLREG